MFWLFQGADKCQKGQYSEYQMQRKKKKTPKKRYVLKYRKVNGADDKI